MVTVSDTICMCMYMLYLSSEDAILMILCFGLPITTTIAGKWLKQFNTQVTMIRFVQKIFLIIFNIYYGFMQHHRIGPVWLYYNYILFVVNKLLNTNCLFTGNQTWVQLH